MAKLKADLFGCSGGEIYPQNYPAGTECPEDLMPHAIEMGLVEIDKKAIKAAQEAERLAKEEAERIAADGSKG